MAPPSLGAMGPALRHVYVHVPFCPTICPFCDFHVLERRAGVVTEYLDRLDAEAALMAERFDLSTIETVYVGGGTPSYLRSSEMARLVEIIRCRVGWATREATLEVHPSTATPERAAEWVALGFTRLSVGVQSFDDAVLTTLGRPHDAASGRAAVAACVATGAVTSLDLITAVPGQDVVADLHAAVELGVDHISAYTLTIEPDTPFARDGVEVSAQAELDALHSADSVLGAAGYRRYEVSNHARPGCESVHNQAYWRNRHWLGLGPSASSHLPVIGSSDAVRSMRHQNAPLDRWLRGDAGESETRDAEELLADAMLCGLRMLRGVDLAEVIEQTGLDPLVHHRDDIAGLVDRGLVVVGDARLRATPAGLVILDQVAAVFV